MAVRFVCPPKGGAPMSDGIMILLIFGLIALLGGGTTALVLLIAKRVREIKERE